MGRVEADQMSIAAYTWVHIAFPVVEIIRINKCLQALHISK